MHGFEVNIVQRLDDYLYVEARIRDSASSMTLSSSPPVIGAAWSTGRRPARGQGAGCRGRLSESRIKALRVALQKKGWKSVCFESVDAT